MFDAARARLAHPAVLGAALVVGFIAPLGPGAVLALHLVSTHAASSTAGLGPARARSLEAMPTEVILLGVLGLALAAYVPRLTLAIASMQAARGKAVRPLEAVRASLGRAIRARGVSVTVGVVVFGTATLVLVEAGRRVQAPLDTWLVVLAAYVATAGFGMASLADRAAIFDVGDAQDARAAARREEARIGGPHYLDTSTARAGYDVATSADDATTVGMRTFLGAAAWRAALVALVADTLPVVVACFALEVAGLGAAWLSPGAFGYLGAVGFVTTTVVVVARAAMELGLAMLWTKVHRDAARGA